jgi:hypothetical protein
VSLFDDIALVESLIELEAAAAGWVNSLIVGDLVSDRPRTVDGAVTFLRAAVAVYGELVRAFPELHG